MNYAEESLRLHGEWKGKIEVVSRVPVQTKDDLSLAYTPGVAQPCLEIQKDYDKSFTLTRRHNLVAVIETGIATSSQDAGQTRPAHQESARSTQQVAHHRHGRLELRHQ